MSVQAGDVVSEDVGNPHQAAGRVEPRTDIQGLRAVAVTLVLLYHLWPNRISGGFVGVDVFFVISGFLITLHLLTKPPRHLRDLLGFWARRIRRLLPASLTVLAVTAAATRMVAPDTQWSDTARQIRAAALYVVNWRLASDAVDYSAADNAATPVQHFWSLSVEEQFYLGWPVLIALMFLLAARTARRPVAVVRGGLLLVVLTSLAYSVHLTNHDPARAYFVTPTRVWELGIGGVLAAVVGSLAAGSPWRSASSRRARMALTWAGLAAIAWSAMTYTGSTPFPGWHAVTPVLGTAAVIAAGDPRGPAGAGDVLALRPVQWVGDVSYSVYLWHWPMVVLLPYLSGGHLGRLDKASILALTLVLAALTKRYIEDPFRSGRKGSPWFTPFVAALTGMALVVAMTAVQLAEVSHRQRLDDARLTAALKAPSSCFGAAALGDSRCGSSKNDHLVPTPAQAVQDQYDQKHTLKESDTCWAAQPDFATKTCQFGDADAKVHVALVGNSHAAQWLGALEEIATHRGWRITTFLAHNCALSKTPQAFATAEQTRGCQNWVRRTTERVAAESFDLVVLSNRISKGPSGMTLRESQPLFADGYKAVLGVWQHAGRTVVSVNDTPWPGATVGSVPQCLAENLDDLSACDGPRSKWLAHDPVEDAVRSVNDRGISSVDLNDHICGARTCRGVVGGVPVYSDFSHLTTTYARTLAPFLDKALTAAVQAPHG